MPSTSRPVEGQADLDEVLPPEPYRSINRRWHGGTTITADEVGELLNLALDRHLALTTARLENERLELENERIPWLGKALRQNVERKNRVLRDCRTALESLPIDALGEGRDGEMVWSLRDELIDAINRALTTPPAPEEPAHA
jgi:hypothetical protein